MRATLMSILFLEIFFLGSLHVLDVSLDTSNQISPSLRKQLLLQISRSAPSRSPARTEQAGVVPLPDAAQ